ncbi:hypothetical protein [Leptolyngbya sp. AN10]|uniref:hypothetical protein n=1 Tax=Leptolyngbya sp. AN10 TaxID=3423365 RepID=UPI003D316F72
MKLLTRIKKLVGLPVVSQADQEAIEDWLWKKNESRQVSDSEIDAILRRYGETIDPEALPAHKAEILFDLIEQPEGFYHWLDADN